MKNDRSLYIAEGTSRMTRIWKNRTVQWSWLVERCRSFVTSSETVAEYRKMDRDMQTSKKDVGGFVGAYLTNGSRTAKAVKFRSLVTLDIDFGTPGIWDTIRERLPYALCVYSTHKHTPEVPRLRLVLCTDRDMTVDEYQCVSRWVANRVGMDYFDDTSYQPERLFFWPSASADGEKYYNQQDMPFLCVADVLESYVDWHDTSEWPLSSREDEIHIKAEVENLGSSSEKPGLIGAYCRAYSIEYILSTELADIYAPTKDPHRFTYRAGSTSGGLVCYDGQYAFSNHATDPVCGRLCNAFDIVRIHRFGHLDAGTKTDDITRQPSYEKMIELCKKDANVKKENIRQKASAKDDFADVAEEDWEIKLDVDKRGNPTNTQRNILIILQNHPDFKDHLFHDDFTNYDLVQGGLPWDTTATRWRDRDTACLRIWFDERYGINGRSKIDDALDYIFTQKSSHPIREYLTSIEKWDGTPRLDSLIIDYLGAEDTTLNRAMTRKHFTAAVARVFQPGCKYDYCLTLAGPEGAGKSTLLGIMGGTWFNDSVTTMEGKQGMEQLRGAWIIELSELSSTKRSDVESIKAFLSKRDDQYRAAYGRSVNVYKRQCVFCGTTNEDYFLKGNTGNRRFWVIKIDPELKKKELTDLYEERDQIWAEALYRYKEKETLYLDKDLEASARERQAEVNDDSDDPMFGQLQQFLDTELPFGWEEKNLQFRRGWLSEVTHDNLTPGINKRVKVSAIEFVCEVLGKSQRDKDFIYFCRKVSKYIERTGEWKDIGVSRHCEKIYGRQRAFQRKNLENISDDDL